MSQHFIVSAVGKNISGIVAQVSREIYGAGCNFEDANMTFLGHHFSLMILVTSEKEGAYEDLKTRCEKLRQEGGLSVSIFKPAQDPPSDDPAPVPNYEIRVKGQDRMGIVYRTSQLLASLRINIVTLETAVDHFEGGTPEDAPPIFTMRTAVVVPETVNREMLRKELEALAEEIYDTVSLTPIPSAAGDKTSGGGGTS